MVKLFILPVLLHMLQYANSANILFFFQVSTYSHRIPVEPYMEELANRGHNVTLFHPYKAKNVAKKAESKVQEFLPPSFETIVTKMEAEKEANFGNFLNLRIKHGRLGTIFAAAFLPLVAYNLCSDFLSSEDVVQFLESSTFDLIVIDALYNECAYGLAHKFGAKTIIFSTSIPWQWHHEPFGVVQETSYLPDHQASFQLPMTFGQRLFSTFFIAGSHFLKNWFYYPKLEALFSEKLDLKIPPIAELERDTSLLLYNSHFSEEVARSLPPMYVGVGGMHCDEAYTKNSTVPEHMKKFMEDSGEEGFIYVSFGTEAKISETPFEFQEIFFNAFEKSSKKFLWKWEGPVPSQMPSNVFTAKWVPQKEVLKHKNCKAFITHGGLMSIQESITHGVPMIVFPIFAEQDMNAFRIERMRRGINLESSTLTVKILEEAIQEILTNPEYKQNILTASKMFKDRPQRPLDTAIYWTEYVLRHDTTPLKPPTMQMYWFQRRLLDVWAVIFAFLLVSTYINIKLGLKIIRIILGRCVNKQKVKTA